VEQGSLLTIELRLEVQDLLMYGCTRKTKSLLCRKSLRLFPLRTGGRKYLEFFETLVLKVGRQGKLVQMSLIIQDVLTPIFQVSRLFASLYAVLV